MIVAGFVALAAVATVVRWYLAERLPAPSGTLLVNLVGTFALGLLAGAGRDATTLLGVAGLGALTTFSTVMVELTDLWPEHRRVAVGYGTATLLGGVGLAWLGLALA